MGSSSTGLLEQSSTFSYPGDSDSDGLPDAWELTYWPGLAAHSAFGDSDHDGYNELLELALGLDPTIPNPGGLPPVTIENGHLTMTLTKKTGVTFEVQSGSTLLPALPDSFSPASTTVLIDDAITLKVRENTPAGSQPRRYLRVKVTATP